MTDKYCPLRFREFGSQPHDQRCIGESCAWYGKCSHGNGEPIYGMPYGNMEPRQVIATEEPQEPREADENANDVDTREKLADALGATDAIEWSQEQLENANPALVNALKEPDSREKLEADAHMLVDAFTDTYSDDSELFGNIIELLDRQAAITERERNLCGGIDNCGWLRGEVIDWDEHIAELQTLVGELQESVHEIALENVEVTAERDNLQAKVDELTANREKLEADLKKRIVVLQAKVDELTAERDALKGQIDAILENDTATSQINKEFKRRICELERENARLSSDELHWHSEADRLRGIVERVEKLLGTDEGLA